MHDFAQRQRRPVASDERRRRQHKLAVQVVLAEAVEVELKFARHRVIEVGVVDAERIEVGDVVATHLQARGSVPIASVFTSLAPLEH